MKECYIFDFDGTLVDSMTPAVKELLSFLEERGVQYPDDIVTTIIPLGFRGIAQYYVEEFGLKETPDEVYALIVERLQNTYANKVPPKPTVVETIRALKARGARLSILTASPHIFLDPCIRRLGIEDCFENLWSSEDFQRRKSEPQIFAEAAARWGISPEECAMVDDNIHALLAAKQAGLRTVAVYDSYSADIAEDISAIADRYVMQLEELL